MRISVVYGSTPAGPLGEQLATATFLPPKSSGGTYYEYSESLLSAHRQ